MWKIEGDKAWIESAHKRQPEKVIDFSIDIYLLNILFKLNMIIIIVYFTNN